MCTICYVCHVYSQDITVFVPTSFGTYVCYSDNIKYGIGRRLCRVRLLITCISEGTLVLHAAPFPPQQLPQLLAQSARPPARTYTRTRTRTVRVTASLRIHSFVLPSDFLSAQLCSQNFICTLLAVCLSLSFFRHPHRQSERLLYRLQYFCQPVVLGFAKQIERSASSCTVHSYCRTALCNATCGVRS